ncbi:MAG: hypothetical protein KC731_23270 [Myxococcales bacterium]|nr:hypothetical protein [Myxococcales bacterium]
MSRLRLLPLAVCAVFGCDIDIFIPPLESGRPAGVITGSVTYSGPAPCTESGRIVGTAVLLGFDVEALPPPQGLGTTPVALSVVSGEVLFASVRDQLPFDPGGARRCGGGDVTVTASFSVSPLPAGAYQIRGFFDRDGDFAPTFSIFNLPTAGDVGGGAIANAADVLLGAAPRYQEIGVGEQDGDGRWSMPEVGARVDGIPVTLGLVLPLERPIFHVRQVLDEAFGNDDPYSIVIPSDYQLAVFDPADPAATEASFVRLRLGAGVAADERAAAAEGPFLFPDTPTLTYARFDENGDGTIDAADSIPETSLVPSLQPVGILSRLKEGSPLATTARPAALLQAVTLLDGLLGTVAAPADLREARDEVLLALRPAVLCIDPSDPEKPGVLVNSHTEDGAGNLLVEDPAALEARLSARFGRTIEVATGCLPQGSYAVNLVYDTGQAWTLPNEAGVCAESEAPGDGTCGTRARLASQGILVQIGEPRDPGYCDEHPTPAACAPAD